MKKNKLYFFLLLTIFLVFINFTKQNQIILPFKTETSNIESSKYIESITDNRIYVTVEIGDKPQKINLYLTMKVRLLAISDISINPSYFNSSKSRSYLNNSKSDTLYDDIFYKGLYANDSFIFRTSLESTEQKKFDNVEFLHVMEYSLSNYNAPGYFGLQIPRPYKKNIFETLKKVGAISSYFFDIKYTSESEGYLSIGELPPEYDNKDAIKRANALPRQNGMSDNSLYWDLKFNDIKFGNIKVNRERTATISPELGIIIGSGEYRTKIKENYFEKVLGDKCQEKEFGNKYYYYFECQKDTDISSFEDLVFTHQEFMYNFVLTKDDLFNEHDNKLYFLVIFDKNFYQTQTWKLGKPFIKKYNFVYDTSNKLIFFYDNTQTDNKKGSNLIYWIIIGILGVGVIVMIILVLNKSYFKPHKKKANELTEDIEYTNADNNNKESTLGI
jgi:hypothetical protein